MAAQPILDFTANGEVFLRTSKNIKDSIKARVHNELRAELQSYMQEVQGEIDGQDSVGRAGLFLAVFRNEHLNPAALLTRCCLEKAAACQEEMDALMLIWHNLQSTESFTYKLTLDQITRYGMVPAIEATNG